VDASFWGSLRGESTVTRDMGLKLDAKLGVPDVKRGGVFPFASHITSAKSVVISQVPKLVGSKAKTSRAQANAEMDSTAPVTVTVPSPSLSSKLQAHSIGGLAGIEGMIPP
jgi:hypothetical protein